MLNFKNICKRFSVWPIWNIGTSREGTELQMILLSRLIHEWDVWEIPINFVGWCHVHVNWILVYLVLFVGRDGLSEIVALFILTDETKTVM